MVTPAVQCTPNKGLFSNNLPTTQFPIDYLLTGGTNNGVAKFDYHLNDHNSLNAEIFTGRGFVTAPISSVTQPYWSTPLGVNSDVARAVWIWTPNSAWVNDARFGFDHSLMATYNSYDCNPSLQRAKLCEFRVCDGREHVRIPRHYHYRLQQQQPQFSRGESRQFRQKRHLPMAG